MTKKQKVLLAVLACILLGAVAFLVFADWGAATDDTGTQDYDLTQ